MPINERASLHKGFEGFDPFSTPETMEKELPRYKCHKEVWALKIAKIEDPNNATDGSRLLSFEENGYAPICVNDKYMHKHRPEIGGYYVIYEDGYESFSPAKAFEDGYTRITGVI